MRLSIRALLRALLVAGLAVSFSAAAQQTITLHGAVQFNDDHAFNKSLLKFEELVKKYYGKPINFVLHRNSELGLEKDYFAYMNQGISVDYGIVSPAHMSTFAKAAPLLDMPFLFRDLDHWNKVLDSDAFQPIVDDVSKKADVMIIGYAGGGTRNIFANKPVRNMAELRGFTLRVMGAPIQTQMFGAIDQRQAVGDRLQRGLQRDPDRRDPGRRERGRRHRTDEVLRSRAGAVDDAARDHRAADRVLGQDLQGAAAGPAGRDPQGGQGSRQVRPRPGIRRRRRQDRRARRRPAS